MNTCFIFCVWKLYVLLSFLLISLLYFHSLEQCLAYKSVANVFIERKKGRNGGREGGKEGSKAGRLASFLWCSTGEVTGRNLDAKNV